MSDKCPVPEIEFPTDYMFKAFGRIGSGEHFRLAVKAAVGGTVPCPDDAIRVRESSGGKYVCVTALVRLDSREQMVAIYDELNALEELMFLL